MQNNRDKNYPKPQRHNLYKAMQNNCKEMQNSKDTQNDYKDVQGNNHKITIK